VKPSDCVDPSDHLDHLTRCLSCQARTERRRRIAETWKELQPSPREIAAAQERFARRSPRPRPVRARSGIVALAVLLAGAAAFASARAVGFRALARGAPTALPALNRSDSPPAASENAASSPPALSATPEGADPGPEPTESVARTAVAIHPPSPPTWRQTPPAPSLPVDRPAAVTAPQGWAEAAQALRRGDHAAAERAFDELARSDNLHTRDAARLARAQLWIAQARWSDARPELESLAAAGATALVRDKATALLSSAAMGSAPEPRSGTNLP
jgi:hypothetical protein